MAAKELKLKPGERFLSGSGVILFRKPRKPTLEEMMEEVHQELLEADADGRIIYDTDAFLEHLRRNKKH